MGTIQHIAAAIRHVVRVPNRKTVEKPSVAAIPAAAVNMPRIDASL